ncbi:MAG: thioredoxin family protein [bacterium]
MARQLLSIMVILIICNLVLSAQSKKLQTKNTQAPIVKDSNSTTASPLVTFVELGSVTCIPCQQMQPVMKAIEEKYGDQINIVFYDVRKTDQQRYAKQYKVRVIPTQVFLNKEGKEFFRHEGFYPEKEIDLLLKKQGLKNLSGE